MPLAFYKVLHVLAAFLVISALGGMAAHAASGQSQQSPLRKLSMALHGVGLLLLLVGGFGALAKLGLTSGSLVPGWAWAKMVIWLLLGGASAVPYRSPGFAKHLLWLTPLLGGIATYLAIYKPF